MCAWKNPFIEPQYPSSCPACGECGSPSWSESAWCFRWSVTHCVIGPCIVMQPRIANVDLSTGPVSNPLWVKYRWKPIVVPNAQSTYSPTSRTRSIQWNATPQRSPIAESSPSGGTITATSVTTRLIRLVEGRTVPTARSGGL